MNQPQNAEKRELVLTGLAFGVSAAVLFVLGKPMLGTIAISLAILALFGVLFYQQFGEKIHDAAVSTRRAVQNSVSYIVLTIVYFCFVSILGAILSLFGMDKLRKDFEKCKASPTMFEEAPATDLDNFRRQS